MNFTCSLTFFFHSKIWESNLNLKLQDKTKIDVNYLQTNTISNDVEKLYMFVDSCRWRFTLL